LNSTHNSDGTKTVSPRPRK